MGGTVTALRGAALAWRGDPFVVPPAEALHFESDAVVALRDGRIQHFGAARDVLPALAPDTVITRCDRALIVPGFIDCHVHYPQLPIIGAAGHPLLEWLERYTFPAELRFADETYARGIARLFLDQLARNGTTSAAVFCTVHPQSVDALFAEAETVGLRIVAGKALMDCNAPPALLDTARRGYDESKALIDRWHGRGRLSYAVTPRFVASSSHAQLEAAAALWREHPGTLLQSHLAENVDEVALVRRLFPECTDYADVLDRFGLLGAGAIHGHGIHLSGRERSRLADTGTALAHCPTSNLFLGSGLFDLRAAKACRPPIRIGLATDVGAGTTFSMLSTMAAATRIAQLRRQPLNPVRALWLATRGAAQALALDRYVGDLAPGLDADVAVLDLAATPLLAARTAQLDNLEELLAVLMTLGDDRCVMGTWAAGERIWTRKHPPCANG
ncbi:MAG: guanine deaminase [Betaproteobacteria bacterium]